MTNEEAKVFLDNLKICIEEHPVVADWLVEIADRKDTADTPHTDKDKVVCPNCGRSDYIRSFEKDFNIKNSGYRYKCINCNTYIKDTPQTEQTDCAWK